jgi:hypothetical protein
MSSTVHPSIISLASNLKTQEAPFPAGPCFAMAKSVAHPAPSGDRPIFTAAAGTTLLLQGASLPAGPCFAMAKSLAHFAPTGDPPMFTSAAGTLVPPTPANAPNQRPAAPATLVIVHSTSVVSPIRFAPRPVASAILVFRPPAPTLSSPPCAFTRRLAPVDAPPWPILRRPPATQKALSSLDRQRPLSQRTRLDLRIFDRASPLAQSHSAGAPPRSAPCKPATKSVLSPNGTANCRCPTSALSKLRYHVLVTRSPVPVRRIHSPRSPTHRLCRIALY